MAFGSRRMPCEADIPGTRQQDTDKLQRTGSTLLLNWAAYKNLQLGAELNYRVHKQLHNGGRMERGRHLCRRTKVVLQAVLLYRSIQWIQYTTTIACGRTDRMAAVAKYTRRRVARENIGTFQWRSQEGMVI